MRKTDKRDQTEREAELDRFWDIDALIPARKIQPKSEHTETAEIVLEPIERWENGVEEAKREEAIPQRASALGNTPRTVIHSVAGAEGKPIHRYITPPKETPVPDDEYEPNSALLRRVRIYRWKSSYQYYEEFVQTAEKLMTVHGKPCAHAPFFSYVPQYSQMDRARLSWYLYLRDCIKQEVYPDTDYSYLLLYIYEIINLADQMNTSEGQALLLRIWANYRKRFRQLDAYLPEWICDYSLIHHLPPPADLDGHLLRRVMQGCRLREFYVVGTADLGELHALLAFCSNYDYKKSKFYNEETKALFDQTVFETLGAVAKQLSGEGKIFSASGMEDCTVTRDSYSGALCSYRMKRKIEVSYCSFSRSHELRFLITDVIKYTENKIRAYLGVRSRLSIYALPIHLRELIDSLTVHLKATRKVEQRKQVKAAEDALYERLYDLPAAPLSLSHASEIERASWETTEKLVEAFAEENVEPEEKTHAEGLKTERLKPIDALPILPTEEAAAVAFGEENALFARILPYSAFLTAVLAENFSAQRAAASAYGKLPDAVADEINEIVSDETGDILIEDNGLGYSVIEDYRDLLERICNHGTE